jgi:FkbM family methyltransferase
MSQTNATLDDLRAAYRLLLGRDPDPEGFRHYSRNVASGISLSGLRDIFLRSEEFQCMATRLIKVDIGGGLLVSIDEAEPEFGRAIARDRTWEPHIVDIIVKTLQPGDTYVDVGANVGVTAFNAARKVGPSGKVVAFEPDLANASRFIEGIAANKFPNVTLHQFALSDAAAIVSLSGGSNTFVVNGESDRMVQAIEGDRLLRDEPRIDFIKLDIEGFEPFALDGLRDTLQGHKPTVLCEFNPRCLNDHAHVDPEQFADNLFRLTSELKVIEHDGHSSIVQDANALMKLWRDKNSEAVSTQFLPNGMLHFDVLFKIVR